MVNVLCAEMTETELAPMVYTNWSTSKGVIPNTTSWPNDFNLTLASPSKTAVDDLFGFNNEQVYPIFPKLPVQYNTIFNATNFYGANAVYLLATSSAGDHTLCSIRTTLSPNCSTEYHATGSGGSLDVNCDPKNRLAYSRFNPLAPSGIWNKDWKDVASEWGSALSLGAGISDGKASNARLLTQLIPTSRILQTSTPSISEALAILAGNTLLLSALDSPFIHYWNYSETVPFLKDPQYQALKATLKVRSYQSGGTQDWQRIFYIVLLLVFIANLFCLSYFIASGNLVTDFVEPQNLFCLSLLSPPSEALEGACAGGPVKGHYSSKFNIKIDKSREHVWFESSEKKRGLSHKHNWSGSTEYELEANPVARMYSRIRKKRSSML